MLILMLMLHINSDVCDVVMSAQQQNQGNNFCALKGILINKCIQNSL